VKYEGLIARAKQLTREGNGSLNPVAEQRRRLTKVLSHDGNPPRWPRVIAGIGETRRCLEQHLEFEEDVLPVLQVEGLKPLVACDALLLTQRTRAAQQFIDANLGWQHAWARALGDKHARNLSPKQAAPASPVGHICDQMTGLRDPATAKKCRTEVKSAVAFESALGLRVL
jgi:hypothetical protein